MKKKIYIIDGSGYIFRAYFGIQQPLSTKDGLPTNALYGFTKMLLSFLEKVQVDKENPPIIIMVFDAARKNFRHDLYEAYKANRAECPEDLVPQMPYFREISYALGFQVLEKEGFEADDVIATIVKIHSDGEEDLVIVSADKDLTQLVTKDIHMWDPMRDRVFTEEDVIKHFGVRADQIADYLSIVGDASDNIPGAKGLGPKTVSQLFQHFNSLEDLLENVEKISQIPNLRGAKGVQVKIESSLESIRLSRELVKLDCNVILDEIDKDWTGFRIPELEKIISDLEFESIFKNFSFDKGSVKSMDFSEKDYQIVSLTELENVLAKAGKIKEFAFDTETDSLDPLTTNVVGISLSVKPNQAFYLPISSETPVSKLKQVFEPLLLDTAALKYGSNLKFDLRVLNNLELEVAPPLFDTMVASQVLNPNTRVHGLKGLAKEYLSEEMVSYADMMDGNDSIHTVPIEKLGKYAAHDADASLRVGQVLRDKFKTEEFSSQEKLFTEIEMNVVPVLARMEHQGIKIDETKLEELESEFSSETERLTTSIIEHAGEEFNLNSPKQLSTILFEKLSLPTQGIKKNQSGYSTDAGMLQKLQGIHPIVDELLTYREVHKLLTTYILGLKKLINPKTGRIHTSYNQAITSTGRLSSSDPNLQNIPIRSERGRRLRELFVAEEGYEFVIADYSQVELRVLAHQSKDENFINAFHSGEDIHLRTAKELFGELNAFGPDAKDYRRIAKTINFGIIYGMGAYRLAGDLGVSRRQAQEFIDRYFNRYPKVREYFEKIELDAQRDGYIETLFGRRRYLEEVNSKGRDKGYAVRSMMNMPIQGTAAEIVKLAMVKLENRMRMTRSRDDVRILLQVHDELVCEVKKPFVAEWKDLIREEMENVTKLLVPLKVDVVTGNTWGDKK